MTIHLKAPHLLGLPPKFQAWRPEQESAIVQTLQASERFVCLAMPTGSGKTPTYIGLSRFLPAGERMLILTATKQLQDQLEEDFRSMGMKDLRGKANYQCLEASFGGALASDDTDMGDWVGVDHGPCNSGIQCPKLESGCTYYDQLRAAKQAPIVVTNYAKWLSSAKPEEEFGKFSILVLDEAHAAADQVCDALGKTIHKLTITRTLGMAWPDLDEGDDLEEWSAWAKQTKPRVTEKLANVASEMVAGGGKADSSTLTWAGALRVLEKDLAVLGNLKGKWVIEPLILGGKKAGMQFQPVWPAPYAEGLLFRGIERVVLVSGTIRPKGAELLGIKREEMLFLEFPSTFPVARRPIVFLPTVRMSARMPDQDLEKMYRQVAAVAARCEDRKGLLHSVSHARKMEFHRALAAMGMEKILISPRTGSEAVKEAIEAFRQAKAPKLLNTPSVETGVDFPLDAAEYCIVPKLPFPDIRGPVMKARMAIDKDYANYLTALRLVQMTGRGMRSREDRFESFILDAHAGWFVWGHKSLFPQWWLNAFRKVDRLPPAPPKLVSKGERKTERRMSF